MKIRTGIDIIEVDRIKDAIEELGESFLNRIFTKNEIEYCNQSEVMKYQHYAARFAVKEAVFKAISEFINGREDAIWKNIEVLNLDSGKPCINVEKLIQNIKKTANNFIIKDIDISISHIKDIAVASVVVMCEEYGKEENNNEII